MEDEPRIDVQQAGTPSRREDGRWDVTFRVRNNGDGPVTPRVAWLPHGRFRCEERALDGHPAIEAGKDAELTFPVAFREEPGTAVENAFVILRLEWRGGEWRVLARLTVTAEADGSPHAKTELITAHRVGFAGR